MAKVTVVERARPIEPPIESVTIQLTAEEAKAVAMMCGFGRLHISEAGRRLMEKNDVSPSRNLHGVYDALLRAGIKVNWDGV